MSSAVVRLAKPKLRGNLRQNIRFHFVMAFTIATSASVAFKIFVADAKKKRYAEFYKTYDIQKDYERIKALGLFDDPYKGDA